MRQGAKNKIFNEDLQRSKNLAKEGLEYNKNITLKIKLEVEEWRKIVME